MNLHAELETLNAQIHAAELRCARLGDEWLKRVQREDLTMLYKKRRECLEMLQNPTKD